MKYIKGNLLSLFKEKKFNYIGHQCNVKTKSEDCAGIAKIIFKEFPLSAELNNRIIKNENVYDYTLLGDYSLDKTENIFNIYSQFYSGAPSSNIDSFDCRISYLHQALFAINKEYPGKSIGLPLLASGLAKNSKFKYLSDLVYFKVFIEKIIKKTLCDMNVTIVYL